MPTIDVISKLLLPGLLTLGGVVAMFWRIIAANHKQTQDKLNACEEKHDEVNTQLLTLTSKVGKLEGHQKGVEQISAAVLEEIKKLKRG